MASERADSYDKMKADKDRILRAQRTAVEAERDELKDENKMLRNNIANILRDSSTLSGTAKSITHFFVRAERLEAENLELKAEVERLKARRVEPLSADEMAYAKSLAERDKLKAALEEIHNEIECCDDVRLDCPPAKSINELRVQRDQLKTEVKRLRGMVGQLQPHRLRAEVERLRQASGCGCPHCDCMCITCDEHLPIETTDAPS